MKPLTKSRFKTGVECPNKLYYISKPEYANTRKDDPFLEALAQGGFQVEELARLQFPGGTLLEGRDGDYEFLAGQTLELLQGENATIYEAAFHHENLFIRTDIIVKRGNKLKLIEVKAKSFDNKEESPFLTNRRKPRSKWKAYLEDVAFQKYVIRKCYPHLNVECYLMMADKNARATVNGLNQMFRISRNSDNRTGIIKAFSDMSELGESVLVMENIDYVIEIIENESYECLDGHNLEDSIKMLENKYISGSFASWPTSYSACKNCEFKLGQEEVEGLKSGYHHCFKRLNNWTEKDFNEPNIFDIWDFRQGTKFFNNGIVFKKNLTPELIGIEEKPGKLSRTERQWIQVKKDMEGDDSIHVEKEGLKEELDEWIFPLNFIDFETSAVALPFHKGLSPYETVAFQYSHHILHEDGRIEHISEFINGNASEFPNFKFIRALKQSLEKNEGTIFRFAAHENTVVNKIHDQLVNSDEPDREALLAFIEEISHPTGSQALKWHGPRDMVDLNKVVKDYYYNPLTKGSNSLKYLLPAILQTSEYLKEKYSNTISDINVSSRNFDGSHVWIVNENDEVRNPYALLPPIFSNWSDDMIEETLSEMEDIGDGGAALIAYAKLQYTDMTEAERNEICKALLRYCELDTLAMVMVYEHLREIISPD